MSAIWNAVLPPPLFMFAPFVISSTPPDAVTVPMPSRSVAVVVPVVTVPKPIRSAPVPILIPSVSVSEPPESWIVPW